MVGSDLVSFHVQHIGKSFLHLFLNSGSTVNIVLIITYIAC